MFYIITRKLLGAFYVDQKKMDLPPSMLSSAIEQWIYVPILANDHVHYEVAFPISFKREKFVVVGTSEGADTIVGIIQDSLSIFKIATSNRVPAYVIAIGV